MMEPQQHGTVADAREAPRKTRDTSGAQYADLLASRDAIDRERQKYFELFELGPDACFLTDSQGIIHEANAAASQLLGVPSQFLTGKLLPSFFEEKARKAYRHQLDQLCGSERSDDWEIRLRSRRGALTDASVSIGRMAGRDKSVSGYRWVVRDISKRKQAESSVRELNRDLELRVTSRTNQLAAANRLKDELLGSERKAREEAEVSNRIKSDFLALLSHEFRTPLQAIFGYTELLEREIHGPLNEPQRRYLQRIQQSQQHLLGLIATILDFAKVESGQAIDVALHPTVVHEVLVHMEGLVGAQLEEKELNYDYRCADSSLVANADAAKLQQIMLNLLANAIKFTDRGGSITLECQREPESIAIRVIDSGKGVPADKLEAIFQPFVQLKASGAVTNGTGLGLPISRRLATAMGGSLGATSEIGKGSTFTLRLQSAT
ncbi:MAG: ATP-binding protein [Gemmatimonadota bacterium]|nr:ATP-binding protein [Gemmatimonadota bacterium]